MHTWNLLLLPALLSEGTTNSSCDVDQLHAVGLFQARAEFVPKRFSKAGSGHGQWGVSVGSLHGETHLPQGVRTVASCIAVGAPFSLFAVYARAYFTMSAVGAPGEDKNGLATRQYSTYELHYFAMWFLISLGTSIVIPESENLAKSLDRGPSWSGLLIGAPWTLICVSNFWLLRPPSSYRLIRGIQLICMLGTGVASLLSALGAHPPESFQWDHKSRANLIMCVRLASGAFEVGSSFPYLLALKIMPYNHATVFQLLKGGFAQVAMSTGPYVGTVTGDLAGATHADQRLALALWALGGAWVIELVFAWIMLPSELDPLLHAMLETYSSQSSDGKQPAAGSLLAQRTAQMTLPQKAVWILGVAVSTLSCLLSCALQAALPTIWQNEFGLGTSDHGLLMSAALATIAVFMPLLLKVRQWSDVPYASMLAALVATLLAGCFLLLLGGTLWTTVLAGLIIFNASSIMNAVIDALASQNSIPGTWFSNTYYAIFCLIQRTCLANTLAPPAARLLLASGGRKAFAVCQLIICCCAVLGALAIHATAKFLPGKNF